MLLVLSLLGCDRGDPNDALKPDPTARERVMHWSRAPGGAWVMDPEPIAWSWSSLHAAVIDGELLLAGLNRTHRIQPWEERWRHFFVDALVSTDARTWKARRYWGEGELGGVDPAFVEDDQGWSVWVAHTEGRSGDPADPHRKIQLMRAPLKGRALGAPVTWTVATGAVDPAPVLFQGKLHVYATNQSRFVVEVMPSGKLVPIWENASVPYVRVKDGELQLVAQLSVRGEDRTETVMVNNVPKQVTRHGDDRRLPYLRRSRDGVTWSEPELIASDESVRSCASPVLVDFAGLEHLYCVDER